MTRDTMIAYAEHEFADDDDLREVIVEGIRQGRLVRMDDGKYYAPDA